MPAPNAGNVTILLGYNAPAPRSLLLGQAEGQTLLGLALQKFAGHMETGLPGVEPEELEPLAWVVANLELGRERTAFALFGAQPMPFLCFNACAWSESYYYYIPYTIPSFSGDPRTINDVQLFNYPDPRRVGSVWRIHRDDWLRNRRNWQDPVPRDIGEQIYSLPQR